MILRKIIHLLKSLLIVDLRFYSSNRQSYPLGSDTALQLSFTNNKVTLTAPPLSSSMRILCNFLNIILILCRVAWLVDIHPGLQNLVTAMILEPDQYTFYVRASTQLGIMSDVRSVSFRISPPFWKRSWSIALAASLLVSAGYSFNYYRQIHMNKLTGLEKIIKEKTKDLEESKTQVEHHIIN